MSVFVDRMRGVATTLFDKFDAPTATITHRAPGVRTDEDMAAGRIPSPVVTISTVKAFIGIKRLIADDGTVRMATVARMNGPAEIGDTLTMNGNSFTITAIDVVNPDQGSALLYTATLK
jgi:hypothetical protein